MYAPPVTILCQWVLLAGVPPTPRSPRRPRCHGWCLPRTWLLDAAAGPGLTRRVPRRGPAGQPARPSRRSSPEHRARAGRVGAGPPVRRCPGPRFPGGSWPFSTADSGTAGTGSGPGRRSVNRAGAGRGLPALGGGAGRAGGAGGGSWGTGGQHGRRLPAQGTCRHRPRRASPGGGRKGTGVAAPDIGENGARPTAPSSRRPTDPPPRRPTAPPPRRPGARSRCPVPRSPPPSRCPSRPRPPPVGACPALTSARAPGPI